MMITLLHRQLTIGWDDLDHYPERKTWRGLFVLISMGYVAMAGIVSVLEIIIATC